MAAPTVEAPPVGDVAGAASRAGRRRRRPGRLGDFVLRVIAGLVLVYLFIPIAVIVAFSFNDPSGKFNLTWRGFTLENWADPFRYSQLTDALWTSLQVAALSTAVSIVLGTLVAVALVRQRFAGDKFVETFLVLPLTAPEVVLGASLLTLFLDFGWNRGFGTIIITHIAFEVSFVALVVRARVRGLDWTLEDAAMDLGAPPLRTFVRVTLPLIVPGIVAAAMLSLALSLDDFIITYFNSGSTVTYPLYVNAATKASLPPQINVLATSILLVSLLLIGVMTLWQRRRLRA
jgi:spermidine/putrescine transport system permease protein